MNGTSICKTIAAKGLVIILAVALVFTMMPLNRASIETHAATQLKVQTPAVVVTGKGLISGGTYSSDNVSLEKSYSIEEMKTMSGAVKEQVYSARKSKPPYTRSYFVADGISISSLIGNAIQDEVFLIASDGYKASFKEGAAYANDGTTAAKPGLYSGRYYYEDFNSAKKTEVPVILSWAYGVKEGDNGEKPASLPTTVSDKNGLLRVIAGQYDSPDDMNQPLFNGNDTTGVNRVQVGDAITETALTIGSKKFTRAEVLLMNYAEATYKYTTKSGDATDNVRGIPISELLADYSADSTVTFGTADNYPTGLAEMSISELASKGYMLAYEANGKGIYSTAKSGPEYGFFTLYREDGAPIKMVNSLTVTSGSGIDFATSPYKHITNGGIEGQDGPYEIDAITGSTLTIEGPGVQTSVPLSVKDLEGQNAGCFRGIYNDTRDGVETSRTYEGVDIWYLLNKMGSGDNGIKLTDKAAEVQIKNRNRQTVLTLSIDDINKMHEDGDPAIISYGTAYADGSSPKPYVFDGSAGGSKKLGNYDGCLKLVYDMDKYGNVKRANPEYTQFTNMAYIYVDEKSTPGFKHDKSPYNTAENSAFVLTLTGDELGREVNYTVKDIEDLVEYEQNGKIKNNGYGYRDEYSLANSSYWYVFEYEGVKLWSLLLHSGLPASKSSDDKTKVKFNSTDNYGGFDAFTLKQIADPDQFGFYEKNAADNNDGKYAPNENIRTNNDPSTGDKLKVGYPVLVSYGVNGYPYVANKKLDGYLSGLSNDGGPLRVINGKLNYNHANGSNQAKLINKIVVGDDKYHYATHKYHSKEAYTSLADNELKVSVTTNNKKAEQTYKIGDIEKVIYDGGLTATQLGEAKVKAFYETKKGDAYESSLYEGLNLNYFLKEMVQLSGSEGTITFTSADKDGQGENKKLTLNLDDILGMDDGYNSITKLSNLSPVIAYAKNGSPLVKDSQATGYEGTVKLAEGTQWSQDYKVENSGGPLEIIFPRESATADDTMGSLGNIISIDVNLNPDKYSHSAIPYTTYENDMLTVSGPGTRLSEETKFTVGELEGKQSLAATYEYSILNNAGESAQNIRYRGLDLYKFLKSTNVQLKNNADKVIIGYKDSNGDLQTQYYELAEISNPDMNGSPVMLAYGSAATDNQDIKDGKALVKDSSSEGYDANYMNSDGPLKLVVGQASSGDVNGSKCLGNVVSINVTESATVKWNHNSAQVYKQYLGNKLKLQVVDKDNKELYSKDYTVEELEAMDDIISQETIYATSENTWEGLNVWKLLQNTVGKKVTGVDDPTSITVFSEDNYSNDILAKVGKDGLKNGVKDGTNYVPVIFAYGVDGLPLTSGGKGETPGEGYDSTIGNNGGPIRLMVHNAQGACIMEVTKVVVKVGDGSEVKSDAALTIKTEGKDDVTFTVDQLNDAALNPDYASYPAKNTGSPYEVYGPKLEKVLEAAGITDEKATISFSWEFNNETRDEEITLKKAKEQNYRIATKEIPYKEKEYAPLENNQIYIMRNLNEAGDNNAKLNCVKGVKELNVKLPEKVEFTMRPAGTDLPSSGVRSISINNNQDLWVGTYGGGAAVQEAGSDKFKTYNKSSEPALTTAFVSAICADDDGGVWMSQNASYTNPASNAGVIYVKDGVVTQYRASDSPSTIPNDYVQEIKIDDQGNVWFGSFGGLTKYDPDAKTWETFTKGFPAESVDNIEFDGEGGIWVGFYPTSEKADGSKPFTGGFAYFDMETKEVKKSYSFTSDQDSKTGQYRLGDVWVRDIAVDKDGSAWVVASGSYAGMDNHGGNVWHVGAKGGTATQYSGYSLVGKDTLSGATNSELRMVAVDPDGGLWFGSSADGVIYVKDSTITDGKMTVSAQYNTENGSWTDEEGAADNIQSIDFYGKTAYIGSNGGLAYHTFNFTNSNGTIKNSKGTAEGSDLSVIGSGVKSYGYYTIKELKNSTELKKQTVSYQWLDAEGKTGTESFEGVLLEDVLNDCGLEDGAKIVKITGKDAGGNDKTVRINVADISKADFDGNKMVLAWNSNGKKTSGLAFARGQANVDDVNKTDWLDNVSKIVILTGTDITISKTISAIDKIGTVTSESGADISEAKRLYDSLSSKNQAKVTNAETLTAAIAEYEKYDDAEKALNNDELKLTAEKGQNYNEIKLSWNKVNTAEGYEIFRATDGDYKLIKNLESGDTVSYVNKISCGVEYSYKVRAYKTVNNYKVYSKMSDPVSEKIVLDEPGDVTLTPKSPTEMKVSWNAVAGAEGYEVYKSATKNGTYELCETSDGKALTATEYTDKVETCYTTYFYMVKAYSMLKGEKVFGYASTVKSGKTPLSKPQSVTPKADAYNQISVGWKNVPSTADGTEVYRASSRDGQYTKVGTVQKKVYIDKDVEMYKEYFYKVRTYAGEGENAAYSDYTDPVSITIELEKPTEITQVSSSGIGLKWKAVDGADGYEIMRADTENGEYSTIGSSNNASYVDGGAAKGKTYFYKIKAFKEISGEVKMIGPISDAVSAKSALDSPVLYASSPSFDTIDLSWTKVKGADRYDVYVALPGGAYSRATSTAGNSYSARTNFNQVYYFKIVAVAVANGQDVISSESNVVARSSTLSKTTVTSVAAGKKKATVRWNSVAGASGYIVYRATGNSSKFKAVKTIKKGTTVKYVNKGLKKKKTYKYKVIAYRTVSKKKYYGAFSDIVSVTIGK